MAQADVAKYGCQELLDYLLSSGKRQEVAEAFQANMINGDAFLSLSEDDLKELLPVIGNRSLVRKLLKKLREVYKAIIIYYVTCTVYRVNFEVFADLVSLYPRNPNHENFQTFY